MEITTPLSNLEQAPEKRSHHKKVIHSPVICKECGMEFIPHDARQQFCTGVCRKAYQNRMYRYKHAQERICPICGKVFTGYGKTCGSNECMEKLTEQTVCLKVFTCQLCGEKFHATGRVNYARYCPKCRHAYGYYCTEMAHKKNGTQPRSYKTSKQPTTTKQVADLNKIATQMGISYGQLSIKLMTGEVKL